VSLRALMIRLAGAVPLLLGISLILFLVVHLAPGGPLDVYADNPSVTPAALKRIAVAYGLDRPLPVQYVKWLGAMLTGDWGFSIRTGRPVIREVADRLGPTLQLGGLSMLISFFVAAPMGVIGAARRGRAVDRVLSFLALAGLSIPVFWLALVLQLIFSVSLGWLPSAGYETIGSPSVLDRLAHMVMPATVLSVATIAGWSRYFRSGMIDVLRQDYIRTAYAKGLGERAVLIRHALRNAAIPAVTIIALDLASIISGAVITETVFGWPGIGALFVESMDGRDYPVLMGLLILGSGAVIAANILADLVQAALDPRIRGG
jgi:peptide/nickel transport system permease protein